MARFTTDRRGMLAAAGGLGLWTLLGAGARAEAPATSVTGVVKTSNGPVRGLVIEGIPTFLGLR